MLFYDTPGLVSAPGGHDYDGSDAAARTNYEAEVDDSGAADGDGGDGGDDGATDANKDDGRSQGRGQTGGNPRTALATKKQHRYVRPLVNAALEAVPTVDLVVLVVDAARRTGGPDGYLDRAVRDVVAAATVGDRESNSGGGGGIAAGAAGAALRPGVGMTPRFALALNKADLVRPKEGLLRLVDRVQASLQDSFQSLSPAAKGPGGNGNSDIKGNAREGRGGGGSSGGSSGGVAFEHVWMLEAKRGAADPGLQLMRSELLVAAEATEPRPWEYPGDLVTELSDLERCVEIVRQQIFQHTQQDVPYLVVQENRGWTPQPDGSLRIDQELQVPRELPSTQPILTSYWETKRSLTSIKPHFRPLQRQAMHEPICTGKVPAASCSLHWSACHFRILAGNTWQALGGARRLSASLKAAAVHQHRRSAVLYGTFQPG